MAVRPLDAGSWGLPGQVAIALVNDPPLRSRCDRFGRIAQLVEQLTLNQRVQGSSPCAPTNDFNDLAKNNRGTVYVFCEMFCSFCSSSVLLSASARSNLATAESASLVVRPR